MKRVVSGIVLLSTFVATPLTSDVPPSSDTPMHGQALSLADLRGKVVVRNLGARHLAVIAVNVREPSPVVREYIGALTR